MPEAKKELKLNTFFSRLWSLLVPSHKPIKILVVFTVALESVKLVGPYILKLIIDDITNFDVSRILNLSLLIILMFIVNQIVSLIDYSVDKRIISIVANAEKYLTLSSFRKLLFLPLGYHEKENTGSKIIKIEKGVDKIINLVGYFFWNVLPSSFQVLFTSIVLLWVDVRFAAVFFTLIPFFVYFTIKVNLDVRDKRRARYKNYELSSDRLVQAMINVNTVKSFVQEKTEFTALEKIREKIKIILLGEYFHIFKANLGRFFLVDLCRASVLFLGIYFVYRQSITIGTLVFVFTISEKALISLFSISKIYDRIMEGSEAIDRLYKLNNETSEINNPKAGVVPKNVEGKIEFCNVTFSYGGKKKVLDRINLKILSGGITALVGPSGGGKTTVARMIYRHYDPQSGKVTLDDIDLKDYDLYAFRKFISIVPQEVEIFNGSVKENIAYAVPGASDLEIIAAAKIANAHEFIEKLPQKYNAEVGERGIKLSGGQRQRVGIARAILANPRVLIFDEATSNLDSYSEKLIQEAIDKIKEGRTIIIIAHRLSTIKKADKIIVLENGKVVEEGNHYELSQIEGGLYAKLNELQKMGDVE